MVAEVERIYGNRVRVRVCGICLKDEQILLIQHLGVGEKQSLWAPPGGGLDFGESVEQTLIREYKEETGLEIEVREFLFTNEFLAPPLHAIELFFRVEIKNGTPVKGSDPEMEANKQIIQEIRFWDFADILLEDPLLFHKVLRSTQSAEELLGKKGLLR